MSQTSTSATTGGGEKGNAVDLTSPCHVCGEPRGVVTPCPHCGME